MSDPCSIPDCSKPRRGTRLYCVAHYTRWLRHGDPLGGMTGRGEARQFFHDVVLPHEGTDCLSWPYSTNRDGYAILRKDGQARVSRMVCEAKHGPAPTPAHQAAHSCGNPGCVNHGHISWKTPAENTEDKFLHGTIVYGEQHGSSKLTEADVRAIRALKGKLLQRQIAKQFGISQHNVGCILRGETWARVEAWL